MMRACYETACKICAAFCAMAVFAVLTACVPMSVNLPGDLRVEAVSVVIEPDWTRATIPDEPFPPEEIGLSRRKIVSDYKRALESELIPATQDNTRPVILQVAINKMFIPGTGQELGIQATETSPILSAHLNIIDVQTNQTLVSDKRVRVFVLQYVYKTMVQDYNTLISEFVAEVKAGFLG